MLVSRLGMVQREHHIAQRAPHGADVIDTRLRGRGGHSRFERAAGNSHQETRRYVHAVDDLQAKGWPVTTLDCTIETPDVIAARIVSLIHRVRQEKSPACL